MSETRELSSQRQQVVAERRGTYKYVGYTAHNEEYVPYCPQPRDLSDLFDEHGRPIVKRRTTSVFSVVTTDDQGTHTVTDLYTRDVGRSVDTSKSTGMSREEVRGFVSQALESSFINVFRVMRGE